MALHLMALLFLIFSATPALGAPVLIADLDPEVLSRMPTFTLSACQSQAMSSYPDSTFNEVSHDGSRAPNLWAQIGECEYAKKDYGAAAYYYGRVNGDSLPGERSSHLFWHQALSYEHLHDIEDAHTAIARAKEYTSGPGQIPNPQIIHDFNRLERIQSPRQLAALQEMKTEQASTQALVRKLAHDGQIEKREFAKSFSGDKRSVALEMGEPCRETSSENALGITETWWYFCPPDEFSQAESFTFRNGRLIDHSTW